MSTSNQRTNEDESSGGIKGDAALTAFWYAREHSASVSDATRVSKDADAVVKEFYQKRDAGEPVANVIKEAQNKAKTAEVMVAAMKGVKFISGNSIINLNKVLDDLAENEEEINELSQRLPESNEELLAYFQTVKTKAMNTKNDYQNKLRTETENVRAAEKKIEEMTQAANAIWEANNTANEFCTPLRF